MVVIKDLRSQLVMAKALAYAIRVIESLPVEWREESDKEDMKVLLSQFSVFAGIATNSANWHLDRAGVADVACQDQLDDEEDRRGDFR